MRTPGDLALLILDDVMTEHTRGRRALARELADIEDAYIRVAVRGGADRDNPLEAGIRDLLDLRRRVSMRYRALEGVNQPGMERSLARAWFPGISHSDEAEEVDDVLDRALRGLRALREHVGESVDMLATIADAEQSQQFEKLQLVIALVGAVVVWPTLVFGFYGANTDLPGRDRTSGLVVMIVVSALGVALAVAFCLVTWRKRGGRIPRDEAH